MKELYCVLEVMKTILFEVFGFYMNAVTLLERHG